MNKSVAIRIVVATLLSLSSVGNARNYYRGKDYLKVGRSTYEVHVYSNNILSLENVENRLLEELPYNTEEQRYISMSEGPVICPDQEQMKKTVNAVLNPENKPLGIGISLLMAVDTQTGLVKELSIAFHIKNNRRKVYSIPPEKIEELENSIVGHSFGFVVPEYFRSANYLRGVFSYKF